MAAFAPGTLVEHKISGEIMSVILVQDNPTGYRVLCGWNQDCYFGIVFRCKVFDLDELHRLENQNYYDAGKSK